MGLGGHVLGSDYAAPACAETAGLPSGSLRDRGIMFRDIPGFWYMVYIYVYICIHIIIILYIICKGSPTRKTNLASMARNKFGG